MKQRAPSCSRLVSSRATTASSRFRRLRRAALCGLTIFSTSETTCEKGGREGLVLASSFAAALLLAPQLACMTIINSHTHTHARRPAHPVGRLVWVHAQLLLGLPAYGVQVSIGLPGGAKALAHQGPRCGQPGLRLWGQVGLLRSTGQARERQAVVCAVLLVLVLPTPKAAGGGGLGQEAPSCCSRTCT